MLHQIVLEHVYLNIFLRVVRGVTLVVDDRGRAVVLLFGGVRVEDVHWPLLLGLRGLRRVLLFLGIVLRGQFVTRDTLGHADADMHTHAGHGLQP